MKSLPTQTRIIWIVLLLLIPNIHYAQISRDQVTMSYIFNFAKKITIPNSQLSEYKIALITDNNKLAGELSESIQKKKIQGLDVIVEQFERPTSTLTENQLIFIGENKLEYYMEVFDMVEDQQILLVSEGFDKKSYVMINLLDAEDGSIKFELNQPNIVNQNLEVNDEVLFMGGTVIDIAEVYLKSKHSLRKMELELESWNHLRDSLQQVISNSKNRINSQNNLITQHTETLLNKTNKLKTLSKQIEKQIQQNKKGERNFKILADSLASNEMLLKQRQAAIEKSDKLLQKQRETFDSINNEITISNKILAEKETTINEQKSRLNTLITILFIILILVTLLVNLYIKNRRKNQVLQAQSAEIKTINEELNQKNEKLVSTLKQKKQMQEQLVQSEKMASLGVLSAGIAHEINNPINFVYAGINSLLRDFEDIEPVLKEVEKLEPDDKELGKKIERINQIKKENYFDEAFEAIPEIISDIKIGADRTSEIVKGLRSFARTEKGIMKSVNIHEGIDTSLVLLRNRYKNTIEITKEYDDAIPQIEGYPGKINQVILNILSNAIDAIKDNGQIKITTQDREKDITISIQDNGSGMSEESKSKVFDPFYTTKEVGDGTGLGMSISYGIIAEHSGKIEVNSKLEEGTEFIIILPKTQQHG